MLFWISILISNNFLIFKVSLLNSILLLLSGWKTLSLEDIIALSTFLAKFSHVCF